MNYFEQCWQQLGASFQAQINSPGKYSANAMFNSQIFHRRRNLRLKNYCYGQAGAYFVTICTQNRLCLFGNIVKGQMQLNASGQMIHAVWRDIQTSYAGVIIDTFIVMPNHIHGIILLASAQRQPGQAQGPAPTLSLPELIHRFKTLTTKRYIDGVKQLSWTPFSHRLWQRNYYEHIIRGEHALADIREYITNNPVTWSNDRNNPHTG